MRLAGMARLRLVFATLILMASSLAACANAAASPDASALAARECATAAAGYAGTAVGVFETTVGTIRGMAPRGGFDSRWPGLPADHAAVICYIDAEEIPAPGPGPGAPPYNRAVIAVVDGTQDFLMAGHRDTLPIPSS